MKKKEVKIKNKIKKVFKRPVKRRLISSKKLKTPAKSEIVDFRFDKKIKKISKNRSLRRKNKFLKTKIKTKSYYILNHKFLYLQELKNLILALPPVSFENMTKRIAHLGKISLALISGVFLNRESVADLLIVGSEIEKRKLNRFLKRLESEIGTQIIYAIMDKEEFDYRRSMFDRFIRLLLEGPHQILIDKIGLLKSDYYN